MSQGQVVFESGTSRDARVCVVIPLHNYAHLVNEALESVAAQTMPEIELVVVDDASTDGSLAVATEWTRRRAQRFRRVVLLRHVANAGLSAARNTGVSESSAPAFFPLDADNVLYPRCLEQLHAALDQSDASFAYSLLEVFEGKRGIMGADVWSHERLARANYIDAMALIRTEVWRALGGYTHMPYGWEDYDFWCKVHEAGGYGIQVPNILGRYRVHYSSMLRTVTNRADSQAALHSDMRRRHPWLKLR